MEEYDEMEGERRFHLTQEPFGGVLKTTAAFLGGTPGLLVRLLEVLRPKLRGVLGETMPTFMVMDVVMQRSEDRRRTEALLFGRERGGGSVCATVTGWQPYLLIRAPAGWEDTHCQRATVHTLLQERVSAYLEETGDFAPRMQWRIGGRCGKKRREPPPPIFAVTSLKGHKSIFGYTNQGREEVFLKIEVAYPQLVNALRDVLVGYPKPKVEGNHAEIHAQRVPGVVVALDAWTGTPSLVNGQSETFNSSLDAVLQFMVVSSSSSSSILSVFTLACFVVVIIILFFLSSVLTGRWPERLSMVHPLEWS